MKEIENLEVGGCDGPPRPLPLIGHVEVGGTLGGSFIVLERYLKHCDRRRFGHEVIFFRRPAQAGSDIEGDWPIIDLKLPVAPLSQAAGSSGKRGLRALLHAMPLVHKMTQNARAILGILRTLPQTVRLARLFRQRGYDLIHCNNNYGWQPQALLAAWFARKPVVAHYRTIQPVSWLERRLEGIPKCIPVINDAAARHLEQSGMRNKIVVCRDIVITSPKPFSREDELGLQTEFAGLGGLLIGCISRLEESKGIQDLLAAVHILAPRWPDLGCIIAGDGSKAKDLNHLASALGISNRVRFTGFVSNQFVYYKLMDVFVCPSLAEGGPMTVVEAMQMGCAVVATRVGQVPEWILHGENGLIVEPGQPESLAQAIETLLVDPAKRAAIALKGAETARRLADPLSGARELDDVFAVVADSAARSASPARG